jgi:hypothetical protein
MTKKNTPFTVEEALLIFSCIAANVPDPKFLGLPDPNTLVRGTDPDPSSSSKNSKNNLYFYCFATFYLDNYFLLAS